MEASPSAARPNLAAIMALKKKKLDSLATVISGCELAATVGRSKLKSLDEQDLLKANELGIKDILRDCEQKAKDWNAKLLAMKANKVQSFLDDEREADTILQAAQTLTEEVKGCHPIIDEVKSDRQAENRRNKSTNEYLIKKDCKKYVQRGVCRKLAMTLVRIEPTSEPNPPPGHNEVMQPTDMKTWDSGTVSLHKLGGTPIGQFMNLIKGCADEKAKALEAKLTEKDRPM